MNHIEGCTDTCDGIRPSGYPCRCACHRPDTGPESRPHTYEPGLAVDIGSHQMHTDPLCLHCRNRQGHYLHT